MFLSKGHERKSLNKKMRGKVGKSELPDKLGQLGQREVGYASRKYLEVIVIGDLVEVIANLVEEIGSNRKC